MSQVSISSYFHTRKRGNEDEIVTNKNKVIRLEEFDTNTTENSSESSDSFPISANAEPASGRRLKKDVTTKVASRQILTPQRSTRSRAKQMQTVDGLETPKLVNFWVGGSLSPQKKAKQPAAETVPSLDETASESSEIAIIAAQPGMSTPVKMQPEPAEASEKPQTRKPLDVDEIKRKLKNSSRITELNTKLNKLKSGLDRLENVRNEREGKPVKEKKDDDVTPKQLKPFKTIEFQILSPTKRLTSPLKLKDSPMKNTLLSSPKSIAPKRLFSPMKCPLEMSPVKAPAYQRFQTLAEKTSSSQLQLPFKYRYLLDIFKAVDAVTAMFFNRKEKITFKKLKPAVQRILRKNFHESHLSQIQKLMPDAYKFAQEKTRNFGSTSKQDYYQLVITPNISSTNNSDLKELTLSPQLLIERASTLTRILTDLVFDEHQKFLQTLEVPMSVTRGALKRWHPDFDLESVPEIQHGQIPAPPNVEKFSSARDILNTARNLFNCGTPMERALERMEEKKKADKAKLDEEQQQIEPSSRPQTDEPKPKQPDNSANKNLLKGVPQSLLDKIRAKQAAKALDTMTRRPSVEHEAAKYARLPEVARHTRNVYITEKKGVMPLENVLKKIENSYRGTISMKEIEELLRIIAKEVPVWVSFHEIRNAMYVKLNRDTDFSLIAAKLEKMAADKKNAT